jgi:RNA polymerase sigma-70 factor
VICHPLNDNEVRSCHVLYISSSERKGVEQWLANLKGSSVLTAGRIAHFAARGGTAPKPEVCLLSPLERSRGENGSIPHSQTANGNRPGTLALPPCNLRPQFKYHSKSCRSLLVAVKRMSLDGSFHLPTNLTGVLERCWRKAAPPAEWNLSKDQFQQLLERSASRAFSGRLPEREALEAYLESLRVADLALAGACSAGNAAAWDAFVAQYRPELYRAARAIAGEPQGRELADSLYADLFGLHESQGQRKSLFDYFHGRSKLGTWLRAVLAQRHIDEIRRGSRSDPLEDTAPMGRNEALTAKALAAPGTEPDPERAPFLAMLQTAVSVVLASLNARDRLRLAYYYVEQLTLDQIGKLLGEHEATVSRRLERTRRDVRKRVEACLREERKLSEAQLLSCLEYARQEWPFDLTTSLTARD